MKEELKNQKAITLIALIITIIVLLILAMVSIKLVWDGGIIEHSKNAVNAYNEAQTNELEKFNALEEKLKNYGNGENLSPNERLWKLIKSKFNADKLAMIVGIGASTPSASGYLIYGGEAEMEAGVYNMFVVCSYNNAITNEMETYYKWMNDQELPIEGEKTMKFLANKWYKANKNGEWSETTSVPIWNIPSNEIVDQEIYQAIIDSFNN